MLRRFGNNNSLDDLFGPSFSLDRSESTAGSSGYMTCQVSSYSSYVDKDGKTHTEKFASAVDEDYSRGIREARHAYANSKTGEQKAAHERQLLDKGKKVVMSRTGADGQLETRNFFKGFMESNDEEFERDWLSRAAPFMPNRGSLGRDMMLSDTDNNKRLKQLSNARD